MSNKNKPWNAIDLTGQKFNRLKVVKDSGKRQQRGVVWECLCDCGNKTEVATKYLKNGNIKSCGCLHMEIIKDRKGNKNPSWLGEGVGYQGAHRRIKIAKGQPRKCEVCGTTSEKKDYQWANLSGKYAEVEDYKRMCHSCHSKFDNIVNNLPMGISNWKNHGKKYGYWNYFIAGLIEKIEAECRCHEVYRGLHKYDPNCQVHEIVELINRIDPTET